jgi:cAMP phosphodiesterase
VRSLAAGWGKGSVVAVDAGVHLGAICRILEATQPQGLGTELRLPHTLTSGPFAGLVVPNVSPSANAAHITRNLIDTYLITHPHLDHISGFVINTAGLPGTRPKRLAGLPSTISAFKTHIFNNVIWPNLSDENNGAGLVTYMRLVEGGSPAMGDGDGRGYLEISDGLSVKVYGVSHGHCIEKHSHRGSSSSQGTPVGTRYGSMDASSMVPQRISLLANSQHHPPNIVPGSNAPAISRVSSLLSHSAISSQGDLRESVCVYDSSAYFLRDVVTGREVLIFGDVEPDSISLSPRNLQIWQEAAPKIAAGTLAAVFLECSYDDSQSVDRLYGHLKPVFIIEEMKTLAAEVEMARHAAAMDSRKRKRAGVDDNGVAGSGRKRATSRHPPVGNDEAVSPKTTKPPLTSQMSDGLGPLDSPRISTPTAELSLKDIEPIPDISSVSHQLKGLKVVIIHMKDKLADGPDVGENILSELLAYEAEAELGCEFVISSVGQSLYF